LLGYNISKKFLLKNFLNAAHKDELKIPQPEMGFIAYEVHSEISPAGKRTTS